MNIEFVELQNFRRLKSIRIDLTKETTLFVGANNSGKTSAMIALRQFLIRQNDFTTNDFTLSSWPQINSIGAKWEEQATESNSEIPSLNDWESVLPSMDVWLCVADTELHHVKHLLPTLDWKGGLLGVRLRFEPKDIGDLYKDFLVAIKAAKETKEAAQKTKGREYKLTLWPKVMMDFLQRRLRTHFVIRAYTLDPSKYRAPVKGVAQPQQLPPEGEPIDQDPFKGLIRIDEINAQRGFTDVTSSAADHGDGQEARISRESRKLSEQLRSYYVRHLDPAELPEPSDLDALQAIEIAQGSFDEKLELHFSDALKEVQNLGYPGISDPKLKISTRVRPTDGLSHDAAVQYEVISGTGEAISYPLYLYTYQSNTMGSDIKI